MPACSCLLPHYIRKLQNAGSVIPYFQLSRRSCIFAMMTSSALSIYRNCLLWSWDFSTFSVGTNMNHLGSTNSLISMACCSVNVDQLSCYHSQVHHLYCQQWAIKTSTQVSFLRGEWIYLPTKSKQSNKWRIIVPSLGLRKRCSFGGSIWS